MNKQNKYKVGDKIQFIAKADMVKQARDDDGLIGKVVYVYSHTFNYVRIYLPKSVHANQFGGNGHRFTWKVSLDMIKPYSIPNQQLVLPIMVGLAVL